MRLHYRTLIATALAAGSILTTTPAVAAIEQETVLTRQNTVVVATAGSCVRTKWLAANDICAPTPPPVPVVAAPAPRREIALEERTVYFGFNQTTLDSQAQATLNSLANVLKSEQDVKGARVIGYADRMGTQSYNEQLSRRRAETVQRYIVSRGFVNARVAETRWLGEKAPVTNCPDTLPRQELIACLQNDRKVEVEIDYLSDQATGRR